MAPTGPGAGPWVTPVSVESGVVAAETGTVFSGYGGIMSGEVGAIETTTVPKGTCIALYCAHGEGIPDSLGNAIESGNAPASTGTFGPGSQVSSYRLLPIDGVNIVGNPVTVGEVTPPPAITRLPRVAGWTAVWQAWRLRMPCCSASTRDCSRM